MNHAMKRWVGVGAAIGLAATLAACSSGSSGTDAADDGAGTTASPAVVEFWGWNQGGQAQADAFNATHDTIQLKYVQYPSNADTKTALTNAVQSKSNVPCLVQSPDTAIAMQLAGLATPIGKYLSESKSKFSTAAYDSVTLGGDSYGIPFSAGPQFLLYNKGVYDKAGLQPPTTWDELIADGATLKNSGAAVLNLAGEDPTTLSNLAIQAGAQWFTEDGDSWTVNIDSKESQLAADLLQKAVDNDLVTHFTFTDIAAMSQAYDAGQMVNIPLTTWNLAAWQTRLSSSLGNWAVAPLPTLTGASVSGVPGTYNSYIVPNGCGDVAAAVTAAVSLSVDPDQLKISSSPSKGAGVFPVTPDASSYAAAMLPATLITKSQSADDVVKIIDTASNEALTALGAPVSSLNQSYADLWAKATTKQITFREMLTQMQSESVDALKAQGIKVK
jgi:multiple sugar transport system substrate-binding protein